MGLAQHTSIDSRVKTEIMNEHYCGLGVHQYIEYQVIDTVRWDAWLAANPDPGNPGTYTEATNVCGDTINIELTQQAALPPDAYTGPPLVEPLVTIPQVSDYNQRKFQTFKTVSNSNPTGGAAATLTLNVTEGWNSKDGMNLSTEGTLARIQTSDNDWWLLDTSGGTPAYFLSLEFDQSVPANATISSVKVYIEHYEDAGFLNNELTWEAGGGTLSSPAILQSTNPTVLAGPGNEAVVEWDVTSSIDTAAKANDLKVKITNESTVGKKNNIDHVYVVVAYVQ